MRHLGKKSNYFSDEMHKRVTTRLRKKTKSYKATMNSMKLTKSKKLLWKMNTKNSQSKCTCMTQPCKI